MPWTPPWLRYWGDYSKTDHRIQATLNRGSMGRVMVSFLAYICSVLHSVLGLCKPTSGFSGEMYPGQTSSDPSWVRTSLYLNLDQNLVTSFKSLPLSRNFSNRSPHQQNTCRLAIPDNVHFYY